MPDERHRRVVTVIVPTLGLAERSALIRRAVDCILEQRGVRAIPLVVVNGPQAEPALVEALEARPEVRTIRLATPNLPAALIAGRRAVDTPWFAELDDDDLLLPEALSLRLALLEEDARLDAVVSNGYIRDGAAERLAMERPSEVALDPLAALVAQNWLCPGATLFRSDSVSASLFEGMPQYLEWTYVAVRLAQAYRLAFLDVPTFVQHTDTPSRTWTSDACVMGLPAAFRRLLELDVPSDLRAAFSRRQTNATNRAAHVHLRAGRLLDAWRWHLESLRGAGGWRYLAFTRKLVWGSLGIRPASL